MIIRTPKKAHFTVISNALIEDRRLPWAALGLLIYLLSKPDNWRILPAQLIKERQLGRDGVYRLLKELEIAGYVQKRQVKNSAGRIAGTDWLVFDEPPPATPSPEKPDTGEPHPEFPDPANPPLTNTDISTKTEINKHTYTDRTAQYQATPVKHAQPCVYADVSFKEERQEEETAKTREPALVLVIAPVAACGEGKEPNTAEPAFLPVAASAALEPAKHRSPVASQPMPSLALASDVQAVPAAPVGRVQADLSDRAPVALGSVDDSPSATSAPMSSLVSLPQEQTSPALPPPASVPAQARMIDCAPAVVMEPSPDTREPASRHTPPAPPRFRAKPTVAPLDAHEQEAFAWAARHPFWHSRITNSENLRRNLEEGRAFRVQFLDAKNAKTLASGTSTDQGLAGDLLQNHPIYRGYDHAENYRDFQSSQSAGYPGPCHPGHTDRSPAGERQRKLCPADAARLAEQRLLQRLDRERAECARTIDGCRLAAGGPDAVYHRPPVAADGSHLQSSVDLQLW